MNRQQLQEEILEIRKECDDYKHTVWALFALANHSRWDNQAREILSDSAYSLGRRMTLVNGKGEVTPDLVVERTAQYGLVCEAKKSIPKDINLWPKNLLIRLEKYDRISKGWLSREEIANFDIVFLTDFTKSVVFSDFVRDSGTKFTHNLAIVGFQHTEETSDIFITLKREGGRLSDKSLDESLRTYRNVGLRWITEDVGERMFYDSRPPVVYVVHILWEYILARRIPKSKWDSVKKAYLLEIGVDEVVLELQKYYGQQSLGPRDQEIPKTKWVREAIEFLIDVGYAEKGKKNGNFIIFWKKIRREGMLDKFIRLFIETKSKLARKRGQLSLLDTLE